MELLLMRLMNVWEDARMIKMMNMMMLKLLLLMGRCSC
jgi:hypothetical protein